MTVIVIFILVMKQTKLSDIVLFCLNPLKLKPYFLFLIDMYRFNWGGDCPTPSISISPNRKDTGPCYSDVGGRICLDQTSLNTVETSLWVGVQCGGFCGSFLVPTNLHLKELVTKI